MCHWPIHFNFGVELNLECSVIDILNMVIAFSGFGFAIYQFWKQNKENRATTIEQNNKNWYLSVLVIPYLERINVFFDEMVKSIKELKQGMNSSDLILRAKEQCNRKEAVSAFFTPIETSISTYDSSIRENVSNLGMSLQDEITKIIGEQDIELRDIERRIMSYKGKLIGILYRPIKEDKKK